MFAKHKSTDKKLKRSLKWLYQQTGVQKIVLGLSDCCRHKYPPGTLRCRAVIDGGLKLNGYSGNGVTDIFVRITPPEQIIIIQNMILAKFKD